LGSVKGATYFRVDGTVIGTVSPTSVSFSSVTVISLEATSTVLVKANTVLTLMGTSGVTFGSSYVYGFEYGTHTCTTTGAGTIGAVDYATLNSMTGTVTSVTSSLAAQAYVSVEVTNARVSSDGKSLVFVSMAGGCSTVQFRYVTVSSGKFTAYFQNSSAATACTAAFAFNYIIIN